MKKLISLALILMMSLSMLCCAQAADVADILGTWYMTSLEMEGMSINPASMGMEMVFVFNEDGTVTLQATDEEDETAFWTLDGDTVTIASGEGDDETMALVYAEEQLLIQEEGVTMILGREPAEADNAEIAPIHSAADIAEFDGEWNATVIAMEGMQMPIAMLGMEIGLTISQGNVQVIMDGEVTSESDAAGNLVDGALVVNFAFLGIDVEENVVTLHEDGTLSVEIAMLGGILLFEKPVE